MTSRSISFHKSSTPTHSLVAPDVLGKLLTILLRGRWCSAGTPTGQGWINCRGVAPSAARPVADQDDPLRNRDGSSPRSLFILFRLCSASPPRSGRAPTLVDTGAPLLFRAGRIGRGRVGTRLGIGSILASHCTWGSRHGVVSVWTGCGRQSTLVPSAALQTNACRVTVTYLRAGSCGELRSVSGDQTLAS